MDESNKKNSKRSLGGYYVEKVRGRPGAWRVRHQWFEEGARKTQTIPKDLYPQLGFNPDHTIEEARLAALSANSKLNLDRETFRRAATRAREIEVRTKLVESAFLPSLLVEEFRKVLTSAHFGSKIYDQKQHSRWNTAMILIAEVELDVTEFSANKNTIYKFFMDNEYSLDTANKVIHILNLWGKFVTKKRNTHFEEVPTPRGNVREKINQAYADSEGNRAGGSTPLTLQTLSILSSKLAHLPGQYEWVHASLWLGLRPSEINALNDGENYRVVYDSETGVDILWVYQPKLTTLPKPERWKRIPLIYPEQQKALKFIEAKSLVQPLNKTLQAAIGDEKVGAYSGRKGFADLMLDRGQDFVNISMWLGHTNLDQTYKSYKDKKRVDFKPIKGTPKTGSD